MSERTYDVLHSVGRKASKVARVMALLSTLTVSCNRAQPPFIVIDATSSPTPISSPVVIDREIKQVRPAPSELLREYLDIRSNQQVYEDNREVLQLLETPTISEQGYANAVKQWASPYPIYPFLCTLEAKSRFIKYVIQQDDLDIVQSKAQDNGPDVDGDGVVTLTRSKDGKLYNELGQVIDETNFVCYDFGKEMADRYGIGRGSDKPISLQLPLFITSLRAGENRDLPKDVRGIVHVFNAIFLGNSLAEFADENNWLFIEPQTDELVENPMKHWVDGRMIQLLVPSKDLILQTEDALMSFFLMPDNRWQPIDDVEMSFFMKLETQISADEYYATYGNGEPNPNSLVVNTFEPGDIYDVIQYSTQSGYFSKEQIQTAFQGASLPLDFDKNVFEAILVK